MKDLRKLLDLLGYDVFTDAPECRRTVARIQALADRVRAQVLTPENAPGSPETAAKAQPVVQDLEGFGRAVAAILDGQEWGGDQLEEIGRAAEQHGVVLRGPDDDDGE